MARLVEQFRRIWRLLHTYWIFCDGRGTINRITINQQQQDYQLDPQCIYLCLCWSGTIISINNSYSCCYQTIRILLILNNYNRTKKPLITIIIDWKHHCQDHWRHHHQMIGKRKIDLERHHHHQQHQNIGMKKITNLDRKKKRKDIVLH